MKKVAFLSIIVFVLFIRFWDLNSVPPHLRNDEAALGYNAYSILNTARDEHGNFLPILFQSFGDWKPGLYVYLTVPFVAILGLNEWSVRLPAAISGILGICLFYLLIRNLFQNKKIAILAAFSLAFSPWHIAFSRGAWEAQVTITLIIGGLLFFIKTINQNNKYLIVSAGFLGTSLLISHSAKPAILILLISILFAQWKKIKKIQIKIILLSSLLLILLALPVIFSLFNDKNTRLSSLFFINKYQNTKSETIANDFFKNWANHYNLPTIFLKGDGNPQHSAADFGAFYTIDIIFFLLGFRTLAQLKNIRKETKIFILILLILTPLSSALTSEGINFVRYLIFFLPIHILIGLGLSNCKKNITWGILSLIYLFSFLLYLDSYLIHAPAKNGAWQYGYKQIVQLISPIQNNYQKIYIPQGSDQPYIFFLFYQKYPPEKFQTLSPTVIANSSSGIGMNYVSQLDNIEFVNLDNFNPSLDQSFLLLLPENNNYQFIYPIRKISTIKDLNGFAIYNLYEYIPK